MILLLRWFLSALAVFAAAWVVPGVRVANTWSALIAALMIGLLNALIRPIFIFLTLPINILTLGLFTLVINGAMFYLASSIVKGFDVMNFTSAILGAIVYWLVMWVTSGVFDVKR